MKEIKIKALNASIYADELEEITDGKIRFYDSDKRYLDYWEHASLLRQAEEHGTTTEQEYKKWIALFEKAESVDFIIESFGIYGYTISPSNNLDSIMEDFAETYDSDNELSDMSIEQQKQWLRDNEWICVIGNWWVHLFE